MIASPDDFTVRYRVVEVVGVTEDGERAFANGAREFRTHDGATKYLNELADQQRVGLMQTGVLRWTTHEAAYEDMRRLQAEGSRWI